jgi:ubiquinol-cytochrome c reductase cytochrome b subunit
MLGSLLILLAMPVLDTSRVRGGQFRPLWRIAFWFLATDLVLLGYLGSQHFFSVVFYLEINIEKYLVGAPQGQAKSINDLSR